jgi:hypothetical protein
VLIVQAGYYGITGVWPIASIRSFERVTGPKREHWLVRTVGALVCAIAASLAVGARSADPGPATEVLAGGSALALGTIDVVYVARGRISPVYLADAAAQGALLAGLARARWTGR